MVEKHDGWEERAHTFDEAWEKLEASGSQELTTRAGTPFVARATITKRGRKAGERVLRYFQGGEEYSRCYECCWEYYSNCNRTLAGMYSRAVDEWIGSTGNWTKLTREELLKRIEQNGGPEGLKLAGRDLSALDLGRDAIRDELKARGISEPEDYPAWVHSIARNPEGINLRRAVLQQADLQGANLSWANLQEADLWNANLQGADLRGTNLQEVDLSGKFNSLEGAYLFRARLERTQLTKKQLGRAIGEHRDTVYDEAKEAYLVLKRNFESIGRYNDASWAHVKERQMEKKTHQPNLARRYYSPKEFGLYPSPKLLPGPDLYPRSDSVSFGSGIAGRLRAIGFWTVFYIKHTTWWIADSIAELICGYGESVLSVLRTLAVVYAVFTLGYGLTSGVMSISSGPEGATRTFTASPVDWAIFSLGALTTMDPAGLEPRNNTVQLVAGLEALLGIFLTGLLGFVVANRIRRS